MNECPSELQKEHIEAIADLEARVTHMECQIVDLSDIKENFKVLTYIQEELLKNSKDQAQTNANFQETMRDIGDNIKLLNTEIKSTQDDVKELKSKFDTREESFKIDWVKGVKDFISGKVLPIGGLLAIIYEIMKALKIIS